MEHIILNGTYGFRRNLLLEYVIDEFHYYDLNILWFLTQHIIANQQWAPFWIIFES